MAALPSYTPIRTGMPINIGPPKVTPMAAGSTVIVAVPGECDLELYAGDDFRLTVRVYEADGTTPADLTGMTPASEVAPAPGSDPVGSFSCTIDAANPSDILLHLSGGVSAGLPPNGAWDCQITDANGQVTTLVHGKVTMTAEVTK